jgi:hypothetical protein
LNDVWKYENDILKEVLLTDDELIDEEKIVITYMSLNIKLYASNSIHILGEVKGNNIDLSSKDVIIEGTVEDTMN